MTSKRRKTDDPSSKEWGAKPNRSDKKRNWLLQGTAQAAVAGQDHQDGHIDAPLHVPSKEVLAALAEFSGPSQGPEALSR